MKPKKGGKKGPESSIMPSSCPHENKQEDQVADSTLQLKQDNTRWSPGKERAQMVLNWVSWHVHALMKTNNKIKRHALMKTNSEIKRHALLKTNNKIKRRPTPVSQWKNIIWECNQVKERRKQESRTKCHDIKKTNKKNKMSSFSKWCSLGVSKTQQWRTKGFESQKQSWRKLWSLAVCPLGQIFFW